MKPDDIRLSIAVLCCADRDVRDGDGEAAYCTDVDSLRAPTRSCTSNPREQQFRGRFAEMLRSDLESGMPLQVKDLLAELKSRLMPLYGVRMRGVCLYGSYARGDQQSASDVDVLIIVHHFERYGLEIERTSRLISELSLKYHR